MATTTRKTRMNVLQDTNAAGMQNKAAKKRQLENKSPSQLAKKKRTAFGDITNKAAGKNAGLKGSKKPAGKKGSQKSKEVIIFPKSKTTKSLSSAATLPSSQQSSSSSQQEKADDMSWEVIELSQGISSSQDGNSSQESRSSSSQSSTCSESDVDALNLKNIQLSQDVPKEEPWEDIDAENLGDTHQVALYAHDIFLYYKQRELQFPVADYLNSGLQSDLSPHMRAILVDWLVEVQENFELNHETLYLAVKLVDQYLSHKKISREKLQLIGATALFVACKFDERCPPVVDDFLYICDDAYTRSELLETERNLVSTVGFDIGFPLSYRFLRRYAKCSRSNVETLTLARYILESSLLDYGFVRERDSRLASACLMLALRLSNTGSWNGTLVHYTGYKASELVDLVTKLNKMVAAPPSKHLSTIRTKYSHKVFHEVAKTPALSEEEVTAFLEPYSS